MAPTSLAPVKANGGEGRALVSILVFLIALFIASPLCDASAGDGLPELLNQVHWGETSQQLLQHFGAAATRLPKSLDFGDSYVDVVLEKETLGGVPVVTFFQMDKATHGLKRVQLERPPHGVNPPAFRAISSALNAAYGRPDEICEVPPRPSGGYQAAAEEKWLRDGAVVSAIFRDTTLQAFEGCLFGPTNGWCGLHGQLLVRIGPPDGSADPCSLAVRHGRPVG
jgi:hypothetical protein